MIVNLNYDKNRDEILVRTSDGHLLGTIVKCNDPDLPSWARKGRYIHGISSQPILGDCGAVIGEMLRRYRTIDSF